LQFEAQAKSSGDPILKNPPQKRVGGVAQGMGPEFKPLYEENIKRALTWQSQEAKD
jgi:hypothetical protein